MKDPKRDMPESGIRVSMAAETFEKIKKNHNKIGYDKGQMHLCHILDRFSKGEIKREEINCAFDESTIDAFVRVLHILDPKTKPGVKHFNGA